ncbi:TIGR02710 family CRISPR-associated protein [Candidatus Bathyarchaeota archaeon]|nr:TIGR02710 family CRISPR-associated protein [Candidatus Bathyarchaeota archaeon]
MKALVISVGTGTRAAKSTIEGLAGALAFSINHHNPDLTVFIVTQESEKSTLPLILKKIGLKPHETILIENPDNIQAIYEKLRPKISQLREKYETLVVDYTSGTKAMTAALAVLAALYEADELSYITGERKNGIVQPGTEQLQPIRPYFISAEQKLKTAIRFFNHAQYSAAATILKEILKIKDPKITERAAPILNLAEAYAFWDKFQHEKAFQKLRKIKMAELNNNKRFLGELVRKSKNNEQPEPYFIADLINNSERRAREEGKYDDAVARLYRTIELIAQYRLKTKYGIDPSKCPREKIPQELIENWNIPPEKETVPIALQKDYELLKANGDELGEKYLQDKSLRDLLSKRNTSILAHGLTPITRETWQKLYRKTLEFAEIAVKNINTLITIAKHIKLKE